MLLCPSRRAAVGAGWMVHDQVIRAVNAERAHGPRSGRTRAASRVRTFVPEPVHVPRHRAETTAPSSHGRSAQWWLMKPPSTTISVPVTNDARSDSRKPTASATSRG